MERTCAGCRTFDPWARKRFGGTSSGLCSAIVWRNTDRGLLGHKVTQFAHLSVFAPEWPDQTNASMILSGSHAQIPTRRFLLRRACEHTSILQRETFPPLAVLWQSSSGDHKRHICGPGQLSIPPSVPQSARWQMPPSVMFFVERILLATRRRIAPFPEGNN